MSTQNTTTSLKRYAESQGVEVIERHLPTTWPHALYIPELNTIYLEARQPHCYKRANLAHELGHAHYGDTPTGNGHYDQRQEQRADEYAAHLLINPADFEASAIWHQDCLPAIADDLEVTHHLLKIWMELFQSGKLNSLTYANL